MSKEARLNHHDPDRGRKVSLFRNGRNQAVRIPVDLELPGTEAFIRKEGNRLIIEGKETPKRDVIDILRSMPPLGPEDDFPDVDDSDLPLDDEIIL